MPNTLSRGCVLALAFATLLLASGCASTDTPEKAEQVKETNDPLEPMNRAVFDFNVFLEDYVLKPGTAAYQWALPQGAQDAVHKFLANMHEPWTAVNDLLQANPRRAGTTVVRFVINSTVGVAGFFDVATGWGFPGHVEDMGQTLAVWGWGEDFYLVLPVIGPSNPRDTFGTAFDWYADPVNVFVTNYVPGNYHPRDPDHSEYTWFPLARGVLEAIDTQAHQGQAIDDLRRQSMDFYATVRSVYRQHRDAQIHNRGDDDSTYPQPRVSGMLPTSPSPVATPETPE